jgi:hypothetical protein
MDNKQCVQIKFNQYCSKYQGKDLSLPEQKLFRQTSYGILRSKHIHLTRIGSSLEEPISLKKTCKRLSYHLGKPDLFSRFIETHLKANRYNLSQCKYLILDGSDLTKPFAVKMEGLARVHDGSTHDTGNGYWQLNLIGVCPERASTVLATSRLYSYHTDVEDPDISENGILLEELDRIDRHIVSKQTVVIDRGGDRRVLIERFLEAKRPFIIRQRGDRYISHGGRKKLVRLVGNQTDLKRQVSVVRMRAGKRRVHNFHCGAVRVGFPHEYREGNWEAPLWLVTVQRSGKGRVHFLSYIPAKTEKQAIEIVMEGYGWRWRIEEVHRQVKQDYRYESVSLRRYVALRNFNTLFWMTMGFLYQQLEDVSLRLILSSKEPLIYTGRLKDLGEFYLYKLSRVVSGLLFQTKLRNMPPGHRGNSGQLVLAIE